MFFPFPPSSLAFPEALHIECQRVDVTLSRDRCVQQLLTVVDRRDSRRATREPYQQRCVTFFTQILWRD